tara:strand:+ start:109 stop:486 length:378 start_codon:yes stop_codon:yes gene_type:complete
MSFDARIESTNEVEQTETPKTLTVSQLLEDLDNGIDRKDIRKKYGLTQAEAKAIFSHPKLQGRRVKRAKVTRIQLIDDTEMTNPNQISIPVPETTKLDELKSQSNNQLIEALYTETQDNTSENEH